MDSDEGPGSETAGLFVQKSVVEEPRHASQTPDEALNGDGQLLQVGSSRISVDDLEGGIGV